MRKLIIALSLVFAGFTLGVAATSPLDPVRVAPHIYELALENERVRVLKRTIRNGDTSPLVAQPDRVVIYLNPCAWMVEHNDGEKSMVSHKFGTPTWEPAASHGGDTSNVVQQCSVIEIELKE